MTTGPWAARFRVAITVKGKQGLIVLDQIRTLDRVRTPTCYASPCELTVRISQMLRTTPESV
jgi:hypothetical protein